MIADARADNLGVCIWWAFCCEAVTRVQRAESSVDAALVKLLADQEIRAGRLQLAPSTCLGLVKEHDPSTGLLRQLKAIGLNFRKASACREPPNGIVLTVVPTPHAAGSVAKVSVGIIDMDIEEGTHFATIRSRGVYTL